MDLSIHSPLSKSSPSLSPFPFNSNNTTLNPVFHCLNFASRNFRIKPLISRQNQRIRAQVSDQSVNDDGFVLEDVPHLTNFLPDLPVTHTMLVLLFQSYPNPLQKSQAYAIVKQTFVKPEDAVAEKIVVQKDTPRGVHFRRAGPREKVYFKSDEVRACIVTCGGLCPGINTVIRELVCGLNYMYGVDDILGIEVEAEWEKECLGVCWVETPKLFAISSFCSNFQGGYKGFYSKNTTTLTPKVVNDIHKRGGTFLCTSRGGHDTNKIVDNIQDRGINQVYIIGGDGTQKGAALVYKEVEKRGLPIAVAGIPKTIDNDIAVIDKSFGFDTAVEEAQRAINAAHVEAESVENGVGIVKLMGRYSGFIAMYATLASRDVDCCLIPESPFYLEGRGGLFEFIQQRLKENGHMVIVVAEGAGQEYVAQNMTGVDEKDASGNRLLLDIGLWLTQKIKDHFTKVHNVTINMKYIDPTYMIRAIPSNASDNIYCTLLAHSAVHGAMAGYTGFTVGPVNSRHAYIPISTVDTIFLCLLALTIKHKTFSGKMADEFSANLILDIVPLDIVASPLSQCSMILGLQRVTEATNTVKLTDRMWARLLASTNQPSFLNCSDILQRDVTGAINSVNFSSI
ncbi:hypothetical protein JRO89_XS11G0124100 [Xanthoceras sorbifolium]|uniref:Phosphofructokinase domain-containing protein n=1 Tax=Xanthoceras sorbifolium TaxID=99658 RepID=A0ABQ8HFD6_9ROSI|nr:hypothetical protein JRO89_XS11G0124100 [Xanthoceras sorbifolium]